MKEKVIQKTGPTIFQQIVVPFVIASFAVIILLEMGNYFSEKNLVIKELKAQFSESIASAAAYFEATYDFPIQNDARFLEFAYVFNDFLSSQKNEIFLTKPKAEKIFLHFTNRDKGVYLSVRFIDQSGLEKIVTEGKKRKRDYVSLASAPKDALHNGISDLFSKLMLKSPGAILCGSPFQYQGKWTFLVGIVKSEPETGGTAGAVIFHCDLTEYFNFLAKYEFFGEHVARVISLNYEVMFPPSHSDTVAYSGRDPAEKEKNRDFYDLSKGIRLSSSDQVLFNVNFRASSKIFQKEAKNIFIRISFVLFFALLFIGIVVWIVSKKFSKPLVALIDAVRKFSRGDLSARAHVKTTGEIQLLSDAFNGLAEDLDKTNVSRDSLIREIAVRKMAEEQLRDSEERLKIIFDHAPDAYYLFDLAGTFLDGNKAAEEMSGYKKEELMGKNFLKIKLMALSDMPKATAALARSAMGISSLPEEYTIHRKDGSTRVAEIRLHPVKIQGKVQVLGSARDITRRKKTEEALRLAHEELEARVVERTVELAESKAYVQRILAAITDYIYTVTVRDGETVATTHQPTCLAVTGYTAEEFNDQPDLWQKMVLEEDLPKVRAFSMMVLAGKNPKELEHRIRRKDGEIRWIRNIPVLHYDPSGRLTSYDGIIRDITERKRAQILLNESMEKVSLANKAKDQFLANMSHEVRTPLNAIIGFSCLLESTGLNPLQKGYVEMLRNGGESLLSLITDVIDFSRIASGKVRVEKTHFDLEQLIRGIIKTPIGKNKKKDLRIFCDFDEKVPHGFFGDSARIRRILMQLLSNAIKFTEKGEVEVRVTVDREMENKDSKTRVVVRIEVRDTGIGIPKEKLEAIFDAFVQADISTTRKYGGSGLGLSISKTLVQLLDGTIEVRSEPGKGSTFSVLLPLEVEPAMKEAQIFPLKDEELEGKKILILDDDEMTTKIFSHYCEESKMVVSCSASSGQDALKWLSEQSSLPEIFLVDILLPGLSGYEVAQKMRENKKYENIKLVAVTGDAGEETAFKARQSGFDAFLQKPATRENLIKVIKTVLGDQREKILPVEIVTQYTADELVRKGLKILVVEDNPASQELLSIILRGFEFAVEIASDGREAIEKVKKDPCDLILMDLQMPVMGGIEATLIIRKELHKTMPILALTAGISEDDKEKCFAAGMNDYLMKPLEVPKLKDKIFHWIKEGSQSGPSASSGEKSVKKWDKERAIKELGIPEGLYRELVLGFIEQSSSAIQDLEKAFRGRDFEEVAKAAHFIKGAAGNLRIEEIHLTAKALEAVAKGDQDARMIEEQMGSLKNAMIELKKNI